VSKFNTATTRTATGKGPIVAETTATGTTHEGAPGYARDAKSELFLLAVTNMVGEQTFYESGGQRDNRYADLVGQVARADADWLGRFLRWLRTEANMRSASLVGALEAAHAMLAAEKPGARQIVASVLQRADEPGEALAYWTGHYGRAVPKPVKRGIADAAARLYTERNLLKYDTASHAFRFGDVLDLTHPSPTAPWQGDLFRVALDRRHNREDVAIPGSLTTLIANAQLRLDASREPAVLLNADRLGEAGMTWEDALSLAGARIPKGKLWEAVISSMGYMACLRNLRNFDEAGVSDTVAAQVAAKLADPAEVAKSRQLPMRFLSAHRAAPSLRWSYPLEQALGHCLANIPNLNGRTLVLVDTSTSMDAGFSKDGTLKRWDAAVIFGVALAQRCAAADVVSFSSTARMWGDPHGAHTKAFPLAGGESLLRSLDRWRTGGYFLGGGTATAAALRQHFARHDRVVIVTDEQAASDGHEVTASAPATVPIYTWNLAGYERGHTPTTGNRLTFGGLTDQAFRMIPLLEDGHNANWPF
jgi:TROVE domain-containing protein